MRVVGDTFWRRQGGWCLTTLAAAGAATAWVLVTGIQQGRWPGGGSLPGLVLGSVAGLIFLFETALALKKTRWLRTARWSLPARVWMQAHLWLGLLTVPLVVLHSGGRLGGVLTCLLLAVFAVVILSGLWGLFVQHVLPRWLLEAVPAETVASQIETVAAQYAEEARRLVTLACGTPEPGQRPGRVVVRPAAASPAGVSATTPAAGAEIPGMVRSWQRLLPRRPHPARDLPPPVPSPALGMALEGVIVPYLISGASAGGRLQTSAQQAVFFDDLRRRVPPALRSVVDQLEHLCRQRRQLVLQQRLHFWLHHWLWLHLPLSLALVGLLAAHIVYALSYG